MKTAQVRRDIPLVEEVIYMDYWVSSSVQKCTGRTEIP
jgi:hypothetical protein